ncbi:Steroidogenic acute regulatory protein-like [Homarus americanus]|uniref:Steroidogenic acute regulatory protein-like n=1 Tax=Homarus americanus TaxID=6706 RepID=A0A8J5TM69_HOMAM|nr:Steroidogenic acute regulatory protein-like [Homarus americanus]
MSRPGYLSAFGGPGSMNSISSDFWLASHFPGMQINGRMSAVRRFFCLFVTFDFLFTSLFWAICVLIENEGQYAALIKEIIHYNIRLSIFDIVMAAASRFVILLLFYALLHINHWWMVAWNKNTSYPFEVTLVLLSFFIAWIEAWFVDFRVLPQEARARSVLEAASNCDQLENAPLLPHLERVRDYLSNYTETVGDFYSPMESPLGSDEEDEDFAESSHRKLTPQVSFLA